MRVSALWGNVVTWLGGCGRRRKNVVTHRSSGVWSHSGWPSKAWPRGQRRTDSFRTGSRPMRTRFSSRRPPSSKSRPQSKAFPLAGQYAPTRWISGSTVSSRPSAISIPSTSKSRRARAKSCALGAGVFSSTVSMMCCFVATAQVHGHGLLTKRESRSLAVGRMAKRRPPEVDKGQANPFDRSASENGFIESFNARLPPSTAARLQRV